MADARNPDSSADLDSLRRLATYACALAIVIAVPSSIAFFAAFGGDAGAAIFGDPQKILVGGASAAAFLRWGAVLDMFWSYLLFIPLALFLHQRLRPVRPWLADLATIAAFGYIFVGASGAALLATVGSSLVEMNTTATAADQPAIVVSFGVLRNVVFGLWQLLDPLTAGLWILSVSWLLRADRPSISRFLLVCGIGAMGFSVMTMLDIHSLSVLLVGALVVGVAGATYALIGRREGASSPGTAKGRD